MPDDAELAHSERLVARMCAEAMAAGGRLTFDRYMEMALYEPGLGYYTGDKGNVGADGDFITAPESTPLFARCLAVQVAEVLKRLGGGSLIEFGGGTGKLAADLLGRLAHLGCVPDEYLIMELSAGLRSRQRATIQQHCPDLAERVRWLDRLPDKPLPGVVVANEVLDAFPVSRFRLTQGNIEQLEVRCDGQDLHGEWACASELIRRAVGRFTEELNLDDKYTSEINLRVGPWVKTVADSISTGMVLLIDYGYPRKDYYHPQRNQGTLQCYYRHRVHSDALLWPGLQDITAHVDFSAVAHAAVDAGFEVNGFVNQAQFLIGCGIERLVMEDQARDAATGTRSAQEVKRLVLPTEMGERFKVMGLTKGVTGPWQGFAQPDLRVML